VTKKTIIENKSTGTSGSARTPHHVVTYNIKSHK